MATLATLFGPQGSDPAAAQGDFGGLRRRLNLTDEQQKKIKTLYANSDRRKREIEERLNKLYTELDRLYDRYDFDAARVRAVTDEITEVRRRSLTLYMDNEEGLRRIITREQFDRLRDITKVRKGERASKE